MDSPTSNAVSDPESNRAVFMRLSRLAFPVVGINMLNVLTLVVDTAMCGRLPDAEIALQALGFAGQLIFLLLVAMLGLTVGTVATVARAFGAGQSERVNHVLMQSNMLTGVLGIVVGLLGNLFAEQFLTLMGASALTRAMALDYLRPLLTFQVFSYLTMLYGAVLRGVGNTRLAFLIALAANAVNILLNYALILGNLGAPALGVQGAAYGTVISQVFSVCVFVLVLRARMIPGLFLPMKPRAIDWVLAKELFRVGWPAAVDMVVMNAAFLSIVGMLARVDESAVAAHGIGLRIQALAFVPGLAISQATAALVGQALGSGNVLRARQIARSSMVLCVLIMSCLAVSIVVAAHPIVAIFDVPSGSNLESFAVTWMTLLGYCMPAVGIFVSLMGVFQGAGVTRITLWINFTGIFLFQIPGSYLLGFVFGLGAWGIWVAFPLHFVIKVLAAAFVYRGDRWEVLGDRVH